MTELSTADTETPEQAGKRIATEFLDVGTVDANLVSDLAISITAAITNATAELQRELEQAQTVINGAMDDTRSCGEISCDECNLRTQALRSQLEEARADLVDVKGSQFEKRIEQVRINFRTRAIELCERYAVDREALSHNRSANHDVAKTHAIRAHAARELAEEIKTL